MLLRQIRHFQAVVQENSFTEAAELCHISQSGISQSVRSLEEELGEGMYVTNSFISLKNMTNGNEYRVGQPIRIKVKNANVNSGRIDFELA